MYMNQKAQNFHKYAISWSKSRISMHVELQVNIYLKCDISKSNSLYPLDETFKKESLI